MSRRTKVLAGSLFALALAPWSASAQTSGNDYQIGPKDLLEIRVLEVPELNVERRVSDNGSLELPVLDVLNVVGLTAPEVAEVLGLTPQAVKSRLHRARLSVREQVAPLLGIGRDPSPSVGTCPDVLKAFSQHLEGEISVELCADLERHLESCARCRGAWAVIVQGPAN